MDWYDKGYFKLYADLRRKDPFHYLAKQYLVDTLFEYDGPRKIGRETYNGCKDYPIFNTLTLDEARSTPIDIVICSVHENEPYFARLKEFYPNAKFIRQVGNDLDSEINEELYPNLLASAMTPYKKFGGHKVLYRQEFDLEIFKPKSPINFRNMWSFQNDMEQFEDTWIFWTDLKHKLREFNFRNYGVGCEQGKIYPKRELVQKMLEGSFNLQSKGPWEGYGFNIHNSIYLGRPMIVKMTDYAGKIAESLLVKDQTYLDMDDPELVEKIRFYSNPERLNKMYLQCQEISKKVINFDREFNELVKPFFQELR